MNCNPNNPAFPATGDSFTGVTIREYFSAMAMQALITAAPDVPYLMCAEQAVEHADVLISELNKEKLE